MEGDVSVNVVPVSEPRNMKAPETGIHLYTSCRWKIAYVCCTCTLVLFALRNGMTMSLVCMQKNAMVGKISHENFTVPISDNNNYTTENIDPFLSKSWIGLLLSSYFYGYTVTPLIGGLISQRFGPKIVILNAVAVFVLANALMPLALRTRLEIALMLRIIMGFVSGGILPSIQVLWAQWAPINENARLIAVSSSGSSLGNIIAMGIAGFICEVPVDGGWPFIFYIFSAGALIWIVCWCHFVYDSSEKHPRISEKEKLYIQNGKSKQQDKKVNISVPWKTLLTSLPCLAILIAHVCYSVFMSFFSSLLPIYMDEVLNFEVTKNGIFSSLPFVSSFISSLLFASLADNINRRKLISLSCNRKIFQSIGMICPSIILIGLSYLDGSSRNLAVILMILCAGTQSAVICGFRVSHIDVAPRFAGAITGLNMTFACVAAICVPLITTALTPEGTRQQWQIVFFLMAAFNLFGALFFFLFSKGEELEWAKEPTVEINIASKEKHVSIKGYDNQSFSDM